MEDKKKNMALKSILIDEDENDEELNEELQNLDESEIALLMRQLRVYFKVKLKGMEKASLNRIINKEFLTLMEGQITLKTILLTIRVIILPRAITRAKSIKVPMVIIMPITMVLTLLRSQKNKIQRKHLMCVLSVSNLVTLNGNVLSSLRDEFSWPRTVGI